MANYKFKISGTNFLLLHHNNVLERDRLDAMRKRMKKAESKAGDDRSPPETWKTYLYVSEETGNICIPAENILSCLSDGGKKIRLQGQETLKTHSQRIAFDALDYDILIGGQYLSKTSIDNIAGEFGEHCVQARSLGFSLHVKPCSVGTSSHVRVRPRFSNWSIQGSFDVEADDEQILTLSTLQDLFSTCGRLAGLGDWRPSSPTPGQYGRFIAEVTRG